jgi:PAS domain S-box-containing protein
VRTNADPSPTAQAANRRAWTKFVVVAAAGAAVLSVVVAFVGFKLAGTDVAGWIDYPVQAGALVAAGISCGLLARRSTGRLRTAWALIGAAPLLVFGAGLGAFLYFSVALHASVPYPSAADAGLLIAQILTLAGVLYFPSSPTRTSGRLRMVIDALVLVISMLYVGWSLGLSALYQGGHVRFIAATFGIAYPVLDMVTLTVLLLIVRRAPRAKYGRLALLAAAFTMKAVANSAYAVSFARGGHLVTGTAWADVAFVAALVLLAVAAQTPVGASQRSAAETSTTLWRMLMPWAGLAAVMATATVLGLTGKQFDRNLIYPAVALVVLLMISQVESYRETLSFLSLSRRTEAALQVRTHLLNQVITHAPLGVGRIGSEGRFIDANPRLGSLFHAPMQVLIGAQVKEFVIQERQPAILAQYEALQAGTADTVEEEGLVTRADGSTTWLHWTTTAVRKPDGSFDYFLSMAEDVTARHEAEDVAMENLAGLERLNKMKSEFVSMVSHEFRTALVGIQGFSELIRDDDLEISDIKGLAGDINNDALRLNRMISEMLDLDRMEAGKIHLDLKAVDLNGILEDAVQRAQVGADGHRIVADLDVALPVVSGDSDRLIQVVSNLLSNAIKYSPDGGEVRVTSRRFDDSVEVSVQDHGVGIPAEAMNRVFGRYERFESNRASKVTGTGLGLAISRQIVELHGGRISVESQAGKGSTFRFTIPVARIAVVPALTRAVASTG